MKKGLLFLILFLSGLLVYSGNNTGGSHEEEPFNAGHMIVDHIVDSHEWHIATIGEKHITIPLPIILYDQGKFYLFSSTRFHEGDGTYQGFKVESERNGNRGKIVKVIPGTTETDHSVGKPLDLSITKNVAGIFVSFAVVLLIFSSIARSYRKQGVGVPKGIQSLLEPLILFIRDDIAKPSLGKNYEKFMPFLLTLFFFIFFTNLIGLVPFFPGGANVTGNIGVTLVLALFTFFMTALSGNKGYWQHIFNAPGVPWWLKIPIPLFPVIEIVGVFVKPFVLMIRLFANITAGHIIVMGFISLIFIFAQLGAGLAYGISVLSVLFAIFISLLELLVAFIQAYVFTLLSALYFGMATEEHEHVEEEH